MAACQAQFGVDDSKELELFVLVPLTQEALNKQLGKNRGEQNFEIGVRMNSPSFANLTIRNIENCMLEKQRSQSLLKSSNEALLTFTTELKRIKKVILAAVLTPEESMDSTRMNSENTGGLNLNRIGVTKAGPTVEAIVDPSQAG